MAEDANSVFSTIMNRIRSSREPAADTAAAEMPTMGSPGVPPGSRMPATTQQAAQTLGMPSVAEAAVPTAGAAGATLGGAAARQDPLLPARDAAQQWGGRGGYFYSYTPAKGNTPAKIQMHGGPNINRAGVTLTETSNPDAFRAIMEEYDSLSLRGAAQPYVSLQEYREANPRNNEDTAARDAVTSLISEGRLGFDGPAGLTPEADAVTIPFTNEDRRLAAEMYPNGIPDQDIKERPPLPDTYYKEGLPEDEFISPAGQLKRVPGPGAEDPEAELSAAGRAADITRRSSRRFRSRYR